MKEDAFWFCITAATIPVAFVHVPEV